MTRKHMSSTILIFCLCACGDLQPPLQPVLIAACTASSSESGESTAAESSESSTDPGSSSSGSSSEGTSSDGGSSEASSSESSESGSGPVCPEIVDGVVTFCPEGMGTCRDALVINAGGASSSGPLALYWHGTYESPNDNPNWSPVGAIISMVEDQDGLLVLPYADPAAVARVNNPFPWWIVCGPDGTGCDRNDDFDLADQIIECAIDQGLGSPERVVTAGLSAGGIMTSHLLDRDPVFSAAAVWSGGMPDGAPMVPAGDAAVIVFHGGDRTYQPGVYTPDVYCGVGQPASGCYFFTPASEALAEDIVDAGDFAVVCDHDAGHSGAMAEQGAEFLALGHTITVPASGSYLDSLQSYPFTSGTLWMLANWGCYDAGETSPWN